MSHLDILIPFGLPPPELAADLLRQLDAPALATLAARSRFARPESIDEFARALPHEVWLATRFGMENDLKRRGSPPIATALLKAFGMRATTGNWFVLQPVHIHIARDHLVLTDPEQLMLTDAESRVLFEIAKTLFEETGKQLCYANANTWFVQADDWAALQTSSPDTASGHNIDIWMPKGPGERDWRKIQNEVQMHWFNHAVNDARDARGAKPVNSLWLWGGADAAHAYGHGGYTHACNFSGWTQAFAEPVPAQLSADDADSLLARAPERAIAMLDALRTPALSNDWSAWLDGMRALEERWFSPLLAALKSGAAAEVALILTNDTRISQFSVSKPSLWKFWTKPALTPLLP